MHQLIDLISQNQTLSRAQASNVFSQIVRGELSEVEITALIIALKVRGEAPEEIAGAAEALRAAAVPFDLPDYPYADTCGTGGDGTHTVNISTAAAFVAAAAGIPVAKHGNRSVSSRCGSADVLERSGVLLQPSPTTARRCLDQAGVCFLMAPQYHSGLRHASPVRRALKTRTVFNLLGPLVNPARPPWQVMGVYDPRWCAPLAQTLGLLGARAALVVHGDGLDELALHGPTTAALWKNNTLQTLTLTPEDAGLSRSPISALSGGDPDDNARWLQRTLSGEGDPAHNDAISLNVGALLWITDHTPSLASGVSRAREVLLSGAPAERLSLLASLSNGQTS